MMSEQEEEEDMDIEPDKSEAYYLRLHLLLMKHGKGILKSTFDMKVPDFRKTLQKHKQYLDKLRLQRKFDARYFNILYPKNGPSPNTSDDGFDITLFVALLRHISGLNPQSPWWDVKDNASIPNHITDDEAEIVRIRNIRNDLSHINIPELEKAEFQAKWNQAEEALLRLAIRCNINNFKTIIDACKEAKLDLIPEELRTLKDNTFFFLCQHTDNDAYVETNVFQEAKQILEKHNLVWLSGHRGEGKTSMAARLALSVSDKKRCLLLQEPSDWKYVDLSLKLIQTIIIDNLYGQESLDQTSVASWANVLKSVERVTKMKEINAIITGVAYVLEQSKEEMGVYSIPDYTICHVTSAKLSLSEKIQLLNVHARKMSRTMSHYAIFKCVAASSGFGETFICGFPQIVSEFCQRDELFDLQSKYFKAPSAVFIKFLDDMYLKGGHANVNDRFLALLLVWSKENRSLKRTELEHNTVSEHVKDLLKLFGRSYEDSQLLENILVSLDSHVGGYLKYNNRSGDYEFTHSTICDKVGLTFGKKKKDIALEICPRDFFMQYVVVAGTEEASKQFVIVVEQFRFLSFAKKCCNMLLNPTKVNAEQMEMRPDDFYQFQKRKQFRNELHIHNVIDFEIINHSAFNSRAFVSKFIEYVKSAELVEKVFGQTIMSMHGQFLKYGISLRELDMRLLDYALYRGLCEFTVAVLSSGMIDLEKIDLQVSLMLAIHSRQIHLVNHVLDLGARVTGDAIHIAICRSMEVLESLLKRQGTNVHDCGNSMHGDCPLITAASYENYDAVKLLLKFGANPNDFNSITFTALHRTILPPNLRSTERQKIISILIESGAQVDVKGGETEQTPLHLAAKFGDIDSLNTLIRHGASLNVTDKDGYYPIQTAAVNGRVDIIKQIFEIDRSQEYFRLGLGSLGHEIGCQTPTNGMPLFHLAMMSDASIDKLMSIDIDPNVKDSFGRTPLIYAIDEMRLDIARRLILYSRVDTSLRDQNGRTPLHAFLESRKELSECGQIPLERRIARYFCLHLDYIDGHIVLSLLMFRLRRDINAKNNDGKTPLHLACDGLDLSAIDYLLIYKADYRAVTNNGDSVFHILSRKTDPIAEVVLEYFLRLDPNIEKFLSHLDLDLSRFQDAISRKTDRKVETLGEFLKARGSIHT